MSAESQTWLDENILVGMTAARGDAWHRLEGNAGDNSFAGPVPIERVRDLLARYEAVEVPVEYNDTHEIIPGVKALRRASTGDFYKIFSEGYQIHGYGQWLVDKVGDILDAVPGDLVIANAGGLANGAIAFVQIEAPESFKAAMGVEFRPNFTAVTSLNGRFATTYKWMNTNTVCDNTLAAGMSEESLQAKFKHTSKSLGNITKLRADLALDFLNKIAEEFAAQIEMLGSIPVSDAQWAKFFDLAVPLTNVKTGEPLKGRALTLAEHKREDLTQLSTTDPMCAPWHDNAFGPVQTMNTYDQWVSATRGKDRQERNFMNALSGDMFKLDATTVEQIVSVTS